MILIKNLSIYKSIRDRKYSIFLISYIICNIFLGFILNLILENIFTLFIGHLVGDLVLRLIWGIPLILQLILTFIIYNKNHENKVIKNLYLITFLYTFVCGTLSLFELYYINSPFFMNSLVYISLAQILYQLLLSIYFTKKVVNKNITKIPLQFLIVNIIILSINKLVPLIITIQF